MPMISAIKNRGRQPRQPPFSEVFDVFEPYVPLDDEVDVPYVELPVYDVGYVIGLGLGL